MGRYLIENAFGIQGFNIAWYGVLIAAALWLGIELATRIGKQKGILETDIQGFVGYGIVVAILGARAYYVIFTWSYYQQNPMEIFKIWQGGLAIYGGILATTIYALWYCRHKKISFFQFADIFVPSLALGQAIGRWGNFFNQEAYGQLIDNPALQFFPYGVYIQEQQQWFQATFFYESMGNLCLFLILLWVIRHQKFIGQPMALYLMGYGCIRFLIEGLRSDSLYVFGAIRVSQLVSLCLLGIGIYFYWSFQKKIIHSKMK